MTTNNEIKQKYVEAVDLCNGAHSGKDVPGWKTIYRNGVYFKDGPLDVTVYKKGDKVVIAFAGTETWSKKDLADDGRIMLTKTLPKQFDSALYLYNDIASKPENKGCKIEFVGYSLGATIANLLSHKTGLPSTALAPIGSKHIVNSPKYKSIFPYDDSNIVTFGRKGDYFFDSALKNNNQSGKIYILPDIKEHKLQYVGTSENHDLKNYNYNVNLFNNNINIPSKKIDISEFFGWKNPISGDSKIYTKEYINQMTPYELKKHQKEIEIQAKKIGIPENKDMKEAQSRHGSVVHVRAYTRASGVHVRDYYRSL